MKSQMDNSWVLRVSVGHQADLDSLEQAVNQFRAGTISEAQFRIIRVPQGIYEQRESGTYMLRVRCPAGGVPPEHLRRLGEVAAR